MSRRGIGLLVAGLTIGLPAQPTRAQWQSRGELGLESRAFADDENASTRDRGLGVASRIELAARAGGLAARGRLFGRVDVEDEARNAVFVEEAFLAYRRGWVNVAAGFRTLT